MCVWKVCVVRVSLALSISGLFGPQVSFSVDVLADCQLW